MFECLPWALMHAMSGLQKLRTDLRTVSSGKLFQIVCSAISGLLCSAVSVSAPGTSQTWLATRGSRGGLDLGCLTARIPCQWSLGSACRAIPFVQLRNSSLKVVFTSIWHTSSKYSLPYHNITYQTILDCHDLDLAQTTLKPTRWTTMHARLEWEGRARSVSRCRWCAATATFAGSECV